MKCKYCGASVEPYALFCSLCGKPVLDTTADAVPPGTDSPTCYVPVQDTSDWSHIPAASGGASGEPVISMPEHVPNSTADSSSSRTSDGHCGSSPRQIAEAAAKRQTELGSSFMDNYEKEAGKAPASKADKKLIRGIAACLVIALLAVGYAGYTYFHTGSLRGQLKKANADKQADETTITELNSDISDLDSQVSALKEENSSLGEQVAELTSQIEAMQSDVNQSTYDKETAERNYQDASDEVDSLNTQIEDLSKQLEDAQSENKTLKSENEKLEEENEETQEDLDFYDQHIVFVTYPNTDGYYHKYGCSRYSKTSFIAYNTTLAEANGYSPCPVCCTDADTDTTGEAEVAVSPSPSPSPSASAAPSPSPSSSSSFWGQLFN